LTTNKR